MSNEFEVKDSGEREQFDTGAQRDVQDLKPRFDLISPFSLERLAWVYARGAEKYLPRNWEKGIPFSRCLASAERHLMQFKMGDTDEDHLAQAVWNLMAILHYQEVGPTGLDDLPKYDRLAKDNSLTRSLLQDGQKIEFRKMTPEEMARMLNKPGIPEGFDPDRTTNP